MKVALVALCIGAVGFLLRVLVALILEWARWPLHLEKPRPRGQLLVLKPEVTGKSEPPQRAVKRIGLGA